jgi:hypothetical protein
MFIAGQGDDLDAANGTGHLDMTGSPDSARDETAEHYDAVDAFRNTWAYDREERGLGPQPVHQVGPAQR